MASRTTTGNTKSCSIPPLKPSKKNVLLVTGDLQQAKTKSLCKENPRNKKWRPTFLILSLLPQSKPQTIQALRADLTKPIPPRHGSCLGFRAQAPEIVIQHPKQKHIWKPSSSLTPKPARLQPANGEVAGMPSPKDWKQVFLRMISTRCTRCTP